MTKVSPWYRNLESLLISSFAREMTSYVGFMNNQPATSQFSNYSNKIDACFMRGLIFPKLVSLFKTFTLLDRDSSCPYICVQSP